jgi:hypothetical protein
MRFRGNVRRALSAVIAGGLAVTAAVATAGASPATPSATASVGTTFTIDTAERDWAIGSWGFDIKQATAAQDVGNSQAYAEQVFGNKKIAVLRIPIHAESGWVEADGTVLTTPYHDNRVVQAIRNALVRNGDLVLYANRMSLEDKPGSWYANVLKTDGRLDMEKYAKFLASYVRFINAVADDYQTSAGQPVRVRVLGPDNEPRRSANEGDLTPARFGALAAKLETKLGSAMPQLIMNDDARADVDWLKAAQDQYQPDAWEPLTYAGTHYQSLLREEADTKYRFRRFSELARFDNGFRKTLKVWDTEYHWDDSDGTGTRLDGEPSTKIPEFFVDSRAGVLGVFDHVDQGYTGLTWWSFHPCRETDVRHTCPVTDPITPANVVKSELQSALVDSMAWRPEVQVVDGDGSAAADGTVTTRAFLAGSSVKLWIVNDTTSWLIDRRISIKDKTVAAAPLIETWRKADDHTTGRSTANTGRRDAGDAVLNVPPKSILLVNIDFD